MDLSNKSSIRKFQFPVEKKENMFCCLQTVRWKKKNKITKGKVTPHAFLAVMGRHHRGAKRKPKVEEAKHVFLQQDACRPIAINYWKTQK